MLRRGCRRRQWCGRLRRTAAAAAGTGPAHPSTRPWPAAPRPALRRPACRSGPVRWAGGCVRPRPPPLHRAPPRPIRPSPRRRTACAPRTVEQPGGPFQPRQQCGRDGHHRAGGHGSAHGVALFGWNPLQQLQQQRPAAQPGQHPEDDPERVAYTPFPCQSSGHGGHQPHRHQSHTGPDQERPSTGHSPGGIGGPIGLATSGCDGTGPLLPERSDRGAETLRCLFGPVRNKKWRQSRRVTTAFRANANESGQRTASGWPHAATALHDRKTGPTSP